MASVSRTFTRILDGEHVISEADGRRSRDQITLAASAVDYVPGEILGKLTEGARTVSAVNGVPAPAGATIGTMSATTAAKAGKYQAVCVVGGAGTASRWRITGPNGEVVGVASGNTAFTGNGLTLTITDTGTDPVAGEAFDITVTAVDGTNVYGHLDPAATNGLQNAAAVLFAGRVANAAAAQKAVVHSRDCELNGKKVTWPAGYTTPQKRAAATLLAANGTLLRDLPLP